MINFSVYGLIVIVPFIKHVYFVSSLVYRISSVLSDHTYSENNLLYMKLLLMQTANLTQIVEDLDINLAKTLVDSAESSAHISDIITTGIQDMVYMQSMYDLIVDMKDDLTLHTTNEYESTDFDEMITENSYITLLHKTSSAEADMCVYTPLLVKDLLNHDENSRLNRKLNIINTDKQWKGRQILIDQLVQGFIRDRIEYDSPVLRWCERDSKTILLLSPFIQNNLEYCDKIFFEPKNYKLLYYCLNLWYENPNPDQKLREMIQYCMDKYIQTPSKYLCKNDFPKEKEYPKLYRKIAYSFYKNTKKQSKSQKCKQLRQLLKHLPKYTSKYNQKNGIAF